MILMKRLTSKQVLEVVGEIVAETLPPNLDGNLSVQYDDDGGIEVFFTEKTPGILPS